MAWRYGMGISGMYGLLMFVSSMCDITCSSEAEERKPQLGSGLSLQMSGIKICLSLFIIVYLSMSFFTLSKCLPHSVGLPKSDLVGAWHRLKMHITFSNTCVQLCNCQHKDLSSSRYSWRSQSRPKSLKLWHEFTWVHKDYRLLYFILVTQSFSPIQIRSQTGKER